MADVKNEKEMAVDPVIQDPTSPSKTANKKKKPSGKAAALQEGFCVYLGPSIRGVITKGAVYRGTRQEVLAGLERILGKFPGVAGLIVPSTTLPRDRIKVKTQGTLLNNRYQQLVKETSGPKQ